MHVYIIIMIKYHQRKTSNLFTFHKIHKLDVTICNCNGHTLVLNMATYNTNYGLLILFITK